MSENENQTNETTGKPEQRYLSFSLGSEEFAVPLLSVKEVIAMPEVTPLPFTPPHFLGIMNLRGQIISIIDLRTKLGIKPKGDGETAVIICDLAPLTIGMVVDSINAVIFPKASETSERPDIQSSKAADYILGIYRKGTTLTMLLDTAKALDAQDHTIAAKANQGKAAA